MAVACRPLVLIEQVPFTVESSAALLLAEEVVYVDVRAAHSDVH